jgi:hypothetical protein
MSQVSGSAFQFTRDIGTAGSVQGLQFSGTAAQAGALVSALPSNISMQFGGAGIHYSIVSAVLNYIKMGNTTPVTFYIGTLQVSKIYVGTALVYSS